MSVLGRNDICPCGSGEKYKKCCLDKKDKFNFENPKKSIFPEDVEKLDTQTIISRLKFYGIDFEIKKFKENAKNYHSASKLSDDWYNEYHINASGREGDFIWVAAWILWNRLIDNRKCDEQLDQKIYIGYELFRENNFKEGCDVLLEVWESFKNRIKNNKFNKLKDLDKNFNSDFYLTELVNELLMKLDILSYKDKNYAKKEIKFCQEFLELLPKSLDEHLKVIRRSEASAYINLGQIEKGDELFKKLIEDYPDWIWSYIYWGDQYDFVDNSLSNKEKAKKIYKEALEKDINDPVDREVIKERINLLGG
ncbi:SEC-C motif-containing protein [Halanaerobium saccharolyticum]|uniref:SEC-C motif-containing protein n=2 Tax=Halanaerobium TaxID=2330 RepID=A0A2T5RL34_9FIRM|nr:SEC-C metal-binding domain-containing protein [Halanaerobium saccharolyticum]PTV99842.1 SEC-C motif-containing protein [Halanaerobium saccharolyticum]